MEYLMKIALTSPEREHLLHALSCIESDLPEHRSVMNKLNHHTERDQEMSTKIVEIQRRVTASADQYIQYEVNAADWDRYLAEAEGDKAEAMCALQEARLLTHLEWEDNLCEVFQVHEEQFTISDGGGDSHD